MAKTSTLLETFATEDAVKWSGYSSPSVTAVAGQLNIQYLNAGPFLQTAVDYDLTESSAYAEVYHVPSNSDETYFGFGDAGSPVFGGNQIIIVVNTTTIFFREIVAGVNDDTTGAYDDTTMRWWRIRHTGTTVFWETSPDAETWTEQRSKTAGFTPSAGRVKFGGFNFLGDQTSQNARFDNVNGGTPPPVEGAFVATLAAVTSSTSGSVTVSGTFAGTLAAVTGSFVGTVQIPIIVTGVSGPAVARSIAGVGVSPDPVVIGPAVSRDVVGPAVRRVVTGVGV